MDKTESAGKLRRTTSKLILKNDVLDTVKQWALKTFKRKTTINCEDFHSLVSELEQGNASKDDLSVVLNELEDARAREEDVESYHSAATAVSQDTSDVETPLAPLLSSRHRPAAGQPPTQVPLMFDARGNLITAQDLEPSPLHPSKTKYRKDSNIFDDVSTQRSSASTIDSRDGGKTPISERSSSRSLTPFSPRRRSNAIQSTIQPTSNLPRHPLSTCNVQRVGAARPRPDAPARYRRRQEANALSYPPPQFINPLSMHYTHEELIVDDNMSLAQIRDASQRHPMGRARPHTMYSSTTSMSPAYLHETPQFHSPFGRGRFGPTPNNFRDIISNSNEVQTTAYLKKATGDPHDGPVELEYARRQLGLYQRKCELATMLAAATEAQHRRAMGRIQAEPRLAALRNVQ